MGGSIGIGVNDLSRDNSVLDSRRGMDEIIKLSIRKNQELVWISLLNRAPFKLLYYYIYH